MDTRDFKEYDKILDNCKNENDVQRYLEKNGHLLPVYNWILGHQVHYSCIISKFKFGNQYVSDFAYLTKCSDEWYVVFVEIEDPKKKIFTKNDHFTSEFNRAYEQVQDWERYLKDNNHKIQILNSLKCLRHRQIMRDDNVTFKYLLVYGRKEDKDKSVERQNKFLQKKINDTSVCTFDSIKGYENTVHDYMVLSPRGDDKYAIKYVPTDFICNDQGFFEDEKSDYISINEECRKELKRQGFNIDTYRCKW